MHISSVIAALGSASLVSAYTAIYSKQYCEQGRNAIVNFNQNLGSCYNIDGAASLEFKEVAASYSFTCDMYDQAGCRGRAAAYSGPTNLACENSPIGWVYSYKCYLK